MHVENLLIELVILVATPLIIRAINSYIHAHTGISKDHASRNRTPGSGESDQEC
jgi:hypothetical protein